MTCALAGRLGSEGLTGRKRPRMVWTPSLHSSFLAAVQVLGVETAVPKAIMQVRDCLLTPGPKPTQPNPRPSTRTLTYPYPLCW